MILQRHPPQDIFVGDLSGNRGLDASDVTHIGPEGEGRVDAEALELQHQLPLQLVFLAS